MSNHKNQGKATPDTASAATTTTIKLETDTTATAQPDLTALLGDGAATATAQPDAEAERLATEEAARLELERATVERMDAEERDRAAKATAESLLFQQEEEAKAKAEGVAESREALGRRLYCSVHGFMIDPGTLKQFYQDRPTKSHMTGWLESQIEHRKIVEYTAED